MRPLRLLPQRRLPPVRRDRHAQQARHRALRLDADQPVHRRCGAATASTSTCIPTRCSTACPDNLPAKLATLALPLGNGVEWAYLQGKVGVGECIVIQGPGQQGLACVVAAKEAGAGRIIVTGLGTPTDQRRLALAKRLGAHHTINVEAQDLLETVSDITGGAMADVVIDCASGGPWTVVSAIQLARKGGRILIGGRKGAPVPQFDVDVLFTRFLSVKGMRGHSYQAVELGLQIIASRKYPLEEMCTHTFALGDVDEALRTVGGEGKPDAIHCAVDPWR